MCVPAGHAPGTPVYREKEDMYDEIIELKKVCPRLLCWFAAVSGQVSSVLRSTAGHWHEAKEGAHLRALSSSEVLPAGAVQQGGAACPACGD